MRADTRCNDYRNSALEGTDAAFVCELGNSSSVTLHATNVLLDTAIRQVRILLQPLTEKLTGEDRAHAELIQRVIGRALAGEAPMTGGRFVLAGEAEGAGEPAAPEDTAPVLRDLLRLYGTR